MSINLYQLTLNIDPRSINPHTYLHLQTVIDTSGQRSFWALLESLDKNKYLSRFYNKCPLINHNKYKNITSF